uniref:Isopenicillin N synthase-like Fe(2+) 2OG dioxygenase domain-containing protein n=1 Tax=Arundo donax TaxID=35708 RepID=A0A0A9G4N7_ARUDO
MTFLLHVNDVEGLQIRKDGKWFSMQATPGALVVNIGDIIEILTNGKYKSIEHKAVINPTRKGLRLQHSTAPTFSAWLDRYRSC